MHATAFPSFQYLNKTKILSRDENLLMHTLLSVIDFWVDKVGLDTRITPLNKNESNDEVIKRFVEPWDSFPNLSPEFFLDHIVHRASI